jgi:hypothetical protein
MLLRTIEERNEGLEIALCRCVSVGRLSKPSSDILPSSPSSPLSECLSMLVLLLLLLLLLILPWIAARRAESSFGIKPAKP